MPLVQKKSSPETTLNGREFCSKCFLVLGSHDAHRTIDKNGLACHDYCIPEEEREMLKVIKQKLKN